MQQIYFLMNCSRKYRNMPPVRPSTFLPNPNSGNPGAVPPAHAPFISREIRKYVRNIIRNIWKSVSWLLNTGFLKKPYGKSYINKKTGCSSHCSPFSYYVFLYLSFLYRNFDLNFLLSGRNRNRRLTRLQCFNLSF